MSVNKKGAPNSQPNVDPTKAIPICSNLDPGIDNGSPPIEKVKEWLNPVIWPFWDSKILQDLQSWE